MFFLTSVFVSPRSFPKPRIAKVSFPAHHDLGLFFVCFAAVAVAVVVAAAAILTSVFFFFFFIIFCLLLSSSATSAM